MITRDCSGSSGLSRPVLVLGLVALANLAGCNHSRYGVNYDRRLPDLRRIAIAPAVIVVQSLHTGGVPEARPDMVELARDRLLDCLEEQLFKRDLDCVVIRDAATSQPADAVPSQRFALVSAVQEAILTHHYVFGDERMFDYSVGDAAQAATRGDSADAVLWVSLTGVVPTEGRKALKSTAIAIGVLTGTWVIVPTDQATIMLMLADATNGDVLWFNQYAAKKDIRNRDDIEDMVKGASKYLLKPKK